MPFLARQQVTNTLPLVVAKAIASHWSASIWLTAYESRFAPRRNLEASVRSRGTDVATNRVRDLTEAGLN
jgi:hypothetical protein